MSATDPRIDAYIERAEPFARPILRYLREVVHEASPEIEETMKWSMPHFVHEGIVCSMAAFQRHCAFGFWKESLVLEGVDAPRREAMGQFGRIASVEDLPPREVLLELVREAVRLNREGVKAPSRGGTPKPELPVPAALRHALDENPAARAAFERFSPSQRREYIEWTAEAKREATRERRVRQAVEWIAEGKPRNWKYMKEWS